MRVSRSGMISPSCTGGFGSAGSLVSSATAGATAAGPTSQTSAAKPGRSSVVRSASGARRWLSSGSSAAGSAPRPRPPNARRPPTAPEERAPQAQPSARTGPAPRRRLPRRHRALPPQPQHARASRASTLQHAVGAGDRRLQQTAHDAIGNELLESVCPRTGDNDAQTRGGDRRVVKQPRLADAGRPLDEHDSPAPARRAGERSAQLRAIACGPAGYDPRPSNAGAQTALSASPTLRKRDPLAAL